MLLLPLPSPILRPGDSLVDALRLRERVRPGDILVVSSKAVATVEGARIDLSSLTVSPEARTLSDQCKRSPAFCQAVLDQLQRCDGRIVHAVPGAILTEIRPSGMTRGTILVANAGLDESNTEPGTAIGWPEDPVRSMRQLKAALLFSSPPQPPSPSLPTPTGEGGAVIRAQENNHKTIHPPLPLESWSGGRGARGEETMGEEGSYAIVVSDSTCAPRRRGVTAIALCCCGIDPCTNAIGTEDLYGRKMTITVEATADQLATAANTLMGNAAQAIPAVIIRASGLPFSDFCGWVPGIEAEEDLFGEM